MYSNNSFNLKRIIKKYHFKIFFIVLLFFVFLQEFNIYRNVFKIFTKTHDERATIAYNKTFFSGYCKGSSHGYLFYIKEKYSDIIGELKIPKIINNFNGKEEYWIFKNLRAKIDDKYISLLNGDKFENFQKYKMLDQHDNRCFFLERING